RPVEPARPAAARAHHRLRRGWPVRRNPPGPQWRGPAEGGRDPWLPSRDRAPRERTEVAEDRGSGDHPCHYPLRGSRRPVRRTVADGDVDAAEVGEMDFSSCADRLIQSIAWT